MHNSWIHVSSSSRDRCTSLVSSSAESLGSLYEWWKLKTHSNFHVTIYFITVWVIFVTCMGCLFYTSKVLHLKLSPLVCNNCCLCYGSLIIVSSRLWACSNWVPAWWYTQFECFVAENCWVWTTTQFSTQSEYVVLRIHALLADFSLWVGIVQKAKLSNQFILSLSVLSLQCRAI